MRTSQNVAGDEEMNDGVDRFQQGSTKLSVVCIPKCSAFADEPLMAVGPSLKLVPRPYTSVSQSAI